MQINSKFFIICFLSIYQFCKSEDLTELKTNTTLTNHTIKLSLSYCEWNSDCSGIHTRCVDNQCKCAPNYKYNFITNECEYFRCTSSYECWEYDFERYCSYGTCYCNSGYYADFSNGEKCTKINTYDFTWVWILVAIGIILTISFIIFYVRKRHLAALRASQQPVIIVGNTEYGSTSYQSNQFPAGYPQNFNNPPPPPYSIR